MIYRIYDRYENDTIAIMDIDIDSEKLKSLLKEFHTHLHMKLAKDDADDDISELCEFLTDKKIDHSFLDYGEIDM